MSITINGGGVTLCDKAGKEYTLTPSGKAGTELLKYASTLGPARLYCGRLRIYLVVFQGNRACYWMAKGESNPSEIDYREYVLVLQKPTSFQ